MLPTGLASLKCEEQIGCTHDLGKFVTELVNNTDLSRIRQVQI